MDVLVRLPRVLQHYILSMLDEAARQARLRLTVCPTDELQIVRRVSTLLMNYPCMTDSAGHLHGIGNMPYTGAIASSERRTRCRQRAYIPLDTLLIDQTGSVRPHLAALLHVYSVFQNVSDVKCKYFMAKKDEYTNMSVGDAFRHISPCVLPAYTPSLWGCGAVSCVTHAQAHIGPEHLLFSAEYAHGAGNGSRVPTEQALQCHRGIIAELLQVAEEVPDLVALTWHCAIQSPFVQYQLRSAITEIDLLKY